MESKVFCSVFSDHLCKKKKHPFCFSSIQRNTINDLGMQDIPKQNSSPIPYFLTKPAHCSFISALFIIIKWSFVTGNIKTNNTTLLGLIFSFYYPYNSSVETISTCGWADHESRIRLVWPLICQQKSPLSVNEDWNLYLILKERGNAISMARMQGWETVSQQSRYISKWSVSVTPQINKTGSVR